jgi:hypothetical protein
MLSGSTVVLRDLGGINGTYVNGTRLRGTRSLLPGDRIDIGPFQLTFDGAALTRSRRIGDVELLARGVSCDVRSRRTITSPHRTLSAANLCIRPSEFVRVIGANGAGKSTLMNILSGRALPTEGTVLLNSVDLHANFQALKRDIAYVAQQVTQCGLRSGVPARARGISVTYETHTGTLTRSSSPSPARSIGSGARLTGRASLSMPSSRAGATRRLPNASCASC